MLDSAVGVLCASVALLGAAGCSTIAPSTTVAAPSGPYVAAANEAVVVFHRRSTDGAGASGHDLKLAERWSYVRLYDERGAPLADLRATEHTVVRVTPGEHRFFAKNWAGAAAPPCVAAMRAGLEAGRVYAVEVEGTAMDAELGCEPVRLVPIERGSLASYFERLAKMGSEQRAFLGERRETSVMLDERHRIDDVLRVGGEQMRASPRLSADAGLPWTAIRTP